ncbi:MAG TPA: GntR family transcriptional regulator, partial [Micropruina sp.]|nr:GntR family transcriptional regulator [Micropruina sp.]
MVQRGRPAPEFVAQLRPSGTSQEALLAELRRVLASGRVRPGAQLPLDGIAQAFGVSRTPVREALKTLLGEGLIRHDHRGGYLVHAPSRDEFVELYTIR